MCTDEIFSLYLIIVTHMQFDFSKEDVPERDPEQVKKSINDTNALLEAIKVRMVSGGETGVTSWLVWVRLGVHKI